MPIQVIMVEYFDGWYCWTTNGRYDSGPCDTRDAAIGEIVLKIHRKNPRTTYKLQE